MDSEGTFNVDKERGLLILEDGEGGEDFFTIEDELLIHGSKYMILIREDQEKIGEEEEAGVLRVESREGEEIWTIVEDEREIAMVQKALEERSMGED